MRVLGLLALGGAMGLNFEDLSYSRLKSAFSKVSSRHKSGPYIDKRIHSQIGKITRHTQVDPEIYKLVFIIASRAIHSQENFYSPMEAFH